MTGVVTSTTGLDVAAERAARAMEWEEGCVVFSGVLVVTNLVRLNISDITLNFPFPDGSEKLIGSPSQYAYEFIPPAPNGLN